MYRQPLVVFASSRVLTLETLKGEIRWGPAVQDRVHLLCEPLLQLDAPLVDALHAQGFEIAVETNGTLLPPAGLDWICVSPKAGAQQLLKQGDDLKLVYPQHDGDPAMYAGQDFRHFFLQPMDNAQQAANTQAAIAYCRAHPQWRLSLQTHKLLGIP